MRLADHIIAAVGTRADEEFCGAFTNIMPSMVEAEKFELTDNVAMAAYQLTRSRPSALVQAMPMCRLPYPRIWLEWRGGILGNTQRQDPMFTTPNPVKQGCLVEADHTGVVGAMTFAWIHKDRGVHGAQPLNLAPIGCAFDWTGARADLSAILRTVAERAIGDKDNKGFSRFVDALLARRYAQPMDDAMAKQVLLKMAFKGWDKLANDPREIEAMKDLNRRGVPCLSPYVRNFMRSIADSVTDERSAHMFLGNVLNAWEKDVEGEPSMVEAVITMMNSRNAIEHRSVDLRKLNKARAKHRRYLFTEYRTTHLRLSQAQQRAFRAGLLSKEQAGLHRVRGHFKIRKTGIYWWSPFFRGDKTRMALRDEYKAI